MAPKGMIFSVGPFPVLCTGNKLKLKRILGYKSGTIALSDFYLKACRG